MFYSERNLLRLLPRALRARDFHLYLENGKRLTDLWLVGGKAVLGHKPPRVLGDLKNAAERGLFSPLPHPIERRFLKALGELFPGRVFRLYPDSEALQRALVEAVIPFPDNGVLPDPAFPETEGVEGAVEKRISLWRPFVGPLVDASSGSNQQEARVLIPVLPWPLGPEALVLDKDMDDFFPVRFYREVNSPAPPGAAFNGLFYLWIHAADPASIFTCRQKVV